MSFVGNQSLAVVIPIFRDVKLTGACISSAMPAILRHKDAVLIAINDCSPEVEMAKMLNDAALRYPKRLVVLTNDENLGFVRSVNRGLSYCPAADIILLNSDVLVPDFWLERLLDDARLLKDAGTITPLSNNTTISAFPNFLRENTSPFNFTLDKIDATFCRNQIRPLPAPTGIGFCLYMRRSCIKDVGVFDEDSFGRGYGEENDFCQRALKKGWQNYITPNLYVFHKGGVSFGSEKTTAMSSALAAMRRLHPRYEKDIAVYIGIDPLRFARIERYFELAVESKLPIVLHVLHNLGGGTEQHVSELAQHLEGRAISLRLRAVSNGKKIELDICGLDESMTIRLNSEIAYNVMLPFLRTLDIRLVHFHHLMNLPEEFFNLGRDLGVTQILTCHDFYLIAGNPSLFGSDGVFDPSRLETMEHPSFRRPRGVSPEDWRKRYNTLISESELVIFPSLSTRELFGTFFRFRRTIVASHLEPNRYEKCLLPKFLPQESYRVGVLGALSREKGADLLEAVAELAQIKRLPFSFWLIGYAYRKLKNVKTTGGYDNKNLVDIIEKHKIDLLFFPAIVPETYSYTLSAALSSGLPILAPSIGAFPERLVGRPRSFFFPHPPHPEGLLESVRSTFNFLETQTEEIQYSKPLNGQENFYDIEYIEMSNKRKPTNQQSSWRYALRHMLKQHENAPLTLRETLLLVLMKIYFHPLFHSFLRRLPRQTKTSIRRSLSHRSVPELLALASINRGFARW